MYNIGKEDVALENLPILEKKTPLQKMVKNWRTCKNGLILVKMWRTVKNCYYW